MFVVAFALYANTLSHDYVLDDRIVITGNDFTAAGFAGIGELLTTDSFRGFLGRDVEELAGGRYRPLSLVTFAIEGALFGKSPGVGHLGNVLLFALCCVMLGVVLDALLRDRPPPGPLSVAFVAALLFAAHPVHTEVVANIKGRDEILALLGALGSLWLGLRAVDSPGMGWAVASGVVFFLALLAKENAITFLAVVPLSLWYFRPESLTALKRVLPPLALAALAFLALRQSIVSGSSGVPELLNDPFLGASVGDRFATIAYTLGLYAKLLVWPHPLTYDYSPYHIPIVSWSHGWALLALAVYGVLGAIALAGLGRRWLAAYAIGFYALTLSVVSNVFVPVGTFMGERFLFMPSVGACLLAGWLLADRLPVAFPNPRLGGQAALLAVAALTLALVSLTVSRNAVWQDDFTLTTTDVVTSAGSASANANAADQLTARARETRDPDERAELVTRAVAHLETALLIHPRYERALAMLANTHKALRGDVDQALEVYRRLYELNPRRRNLAYNLGTLTLEHQPERRDEALAYLRFAVELSPQDADALANLGVGYYLDGDSQRAIETLERAVQLAPGRVDLNRNLAELFQEQGDSAKFEYYRAATERLGRRLEP